MRLRDDARGRAGSPRRWRCRPAGYASETLSALERLAIYRTAYHARLIECLSDDYPVLKQALGEAEFEALCRSYVAQRPSTGPSLNDFGRHMADFCGTF